MHRTLLLTLTTSLALIACKNSGEIDLDDTGDTAVDDTDTDTDTDTADTSVYIAGSLTATGEQAVPAGDVTVALQYLEFNETSLVLGDLYARDVVGPLTAGGSVDFAIRLPDGAPPEELMQWSGELDALDEEVALFMLGAFVDTDADGAFDDGEPLIGSTFTLLGYLRGGPSQHMSDMGAAQGWNQVTLDLMETGSDSATPIPEGVDDWALSSNLLPVPRSTVSFVITPALGATVGVDIYAIEDGITPIEPTLVHTTADATLAGATGMFTSLPVPPDDHFTSNLGDSEIDGLELAISQGLAYYDTNTSNEYETSDTPAAMSFNGASPRALAYMRATNFVGCVAPEVLGIKAGWNIMQFPTDGSDEATPVPWGNGLVLVGFTR